MNVIKVEKLVGIPLVDRPRLFDAMRRCTNSQRLAVCLLFMSDLPTSRHHLTDIERELRQVFPPSTKNGLTPDTYVDFQASAVRFYFNAEKRDIMDSAMRLWINPRRGHWANTALGNRAALQVLRREGVLVEHPEFQAIRMEESIPSVTRDFLEKEQAVEGVVVESAQDLRDETPEYENLAAYVDRLLDALPPVDVQRLPAPPGVTVRFEGAPRDVQTLLRGIMDTTQLAHAKVTLEMTPHGWRAEFTGQ